MFIGAVLISCEVLWCIQSALPSSSPFTAFFLRRLLRRIDTRVKTAVGIALAVTQLHLSAPAPARHR